MNRFTTSYFRRAAMALCFSFCAIAQVHAQDLYNDLVRVTSANEQISTSASQSGFRVGYVEYSTQSLFTETIAPIILSNEQPDWDVVGTWQSTPSSAIYWNSHTFSDTLSNGRTLPAQSFVMENADFMPAVEIDMPKDPSNSFTVHTAAAPVNGTTQGNIVLQTLTGGVWSTVFSESLSAPRTDTRSFTATHNMRFRWLLERTTSNLAEATLQVVITK